MKTLTMKHEVLMPVFTFLKDFTLKGKATRGRTQLLKRLTEKNKEFNESVDEIRKTHFQLDEDGEPLVVNGRYVDITKELTKEANQMVEDLNEEEFTISFGEYSTKYENLFTALKALEDEDSEVEFEGDNAFGYSELMDAYEANTTEEEK